MSYIQARSARGESVEEIRRELAGTQFVGENVENVDEDLDWADPLALDTDSVREAARIDAELVGRGEEIPLPDALITGTAHAADMTLVAVDEHFDWVSGLDHHDPADDDGGDDD